jgi:hypothetical protein
MAGRTGSDVDRGSGTWSTFPKSNNYKAFDMTCKTPTSWGQSPKTRRIHLGQGQVWIIFENRERLDGRKGSIVNRVHGTMSNCPKGN